MYRWTLFKGAPIKSPSGAAVAVGQEVYYFEGTWNNIDVHVFNTVSLCWRKLHTGATERDGAAFDFPYRLFGHTAVLIEGVIYLWGGYREEHRKVLYAFDVDAHRWFRPEIFGTVPDPRRHSSACVLGKVMFIYGGEYTGDLHKLDTTTMVWTFIITRFTLLVSSPSATMIGTKMFVFVGQDHIVFDTETNLWLSSPSGQLPPEYHRSRSASVHKGELFGGENYNFHYYHYNNYCGLWKFNPETFSWKKVEPKGKVPPQVLHRRVSTVGDRIIVFGGYYGSVRRCTDGLLYILDLNPSLKTLCKLDVIKHRLEQSELPHDIRWELAAMTSDCTNELAAMTSDCTNVLPVITSD